MLMLRERDRKRETARGVQVDNLANISVCGQVNCGQQVQAEPAEERS